VGPADEVGTRLCELLELDVGGGGTGVDDAPPDSVETPLEGLLELEDPGEEDEPDELLDIGQS
jgi:hypothetical protein